MDAYSREVKMPARLRWIDMGLYAEATATERLCREPGCYAMHKWMNDKTRNDCMEDPMIEGDSGELSRNRNTKKRARYGVNLTTEQAFKIVEA